MYFYTLSFGTYSDYSEVVLYHTKEFTKEQFGEMFNEALEAGNSYNESVAEYLIDNHGFKKVEPTIYVKCEYGSYRKLTDKDYKHYGNELDAQDRSRQ